MSRKLVTRGLLLPPRCFGVASALRIRETLVIVGKDPGDHRRRLDPERFGVVLQGLDHFGEGLPLVRGSIALHPRPPGAAGRAIQLPICR